MNKKQAKGSKVENKKALPQFIIFLFVALVTGVGVGFLVESFSKHMSGLGGGGQVWLENAAPYVSIGITIIFTIVELIIIQKSSKHYYAWDGEDEVIIEKIESWLSYPIWLSSIHMILTYFFFAAGLSKDYYNMQKGTIKFQLIFIIFGLILALISIIFIQKYVIEFEKEINPEKQGSIFDMNFQKKWENSCDELEKLYIYKAAYKSYQTLSVTFILIWVFCVIGNLIWHFGLMPVAMVSIIWMVQITSYCTEVLKLTKQGQQKNNTHKEDMD